MSSPVVTLRLVGAHNTNTEWLSGLPDQGSHGFNVAATHDASMLTCFVHR